MNCRQFRNNHVSFVDDLLSATDMRAMRNHILDCHACASTDVRIRRSLMVMRSLPQVEPSADFGERLNLRLRAMELVSDSPVRRSRWTALSLSALAAGLVAIAALGYGIALHQRLPALLPRPNGYVALKQQLPAPLADATVMAAVPTGIPVWSTMFAAGQLPMRFASVDLLQPSNSASANAAFSLGLARDNGSRWTQESWSGLPSRP